MSLKVANVAHPNSVQNTYVFCCYEAGDSVTNLHIALDLYKEEIKALQSTMWQQAQAHEDSFTPPLPLVQYPQAEDT